MNVILYDIWLIDLPNLLMFNNSFLIKGKIKKLNYGDMEY